MEANNEQMEKVCEQNHQVMKTFPCFSKLQEEGLNFLIVMKFCSIEKNQISQFANWLCTT